MPPTLITSSIAEIKAFRDEHQDIIVKPLFGAGGAGVFHLKPGDENLGSLVEMFTQISREPLIVQRYLPEVRQGDKRVILIDGRGAGALMRVPQAGEARSNLHVGGKAMKVAMTRRDHEICEAIGPTLKEQGLVFVGIDVIGDYLTEINVTSPTGIQEVSRFDGTNLASQIWDAIETRRHAHRAPRA
jgi:glutathione synthase